MRCRSAAIGDCRSGAPMLDCRLTLCRARSASVGGEGRGWTELVVVSRRSARLGAAAAAPSGPRGGAGRRSRPITHPLMTGRHATRADRGRRRRSDHPVPALPVLAWLNAAQQNRMQRPWRPRNQGLRSEVFYWKGPPEQSGAPVRGGAGLPVVVNLAGRRPSMGTALAPSDPAMILNSAVVSN